MIAIGWVVGVAASLAATLVMGLARRRSDEPWIHPADWVTMGRAVLAAGVAGLVASSVARPLAVAPTVALAVVALVLDWVDGQVARRTRTATALGGRFDGEVDAFLILVLSVAVAREYGDWVLAIGLARYAFLVAGWLVPWLAGQLPPRYWRKVVAAVQGIVLTVAVSGVVSQLVGMIAVAAALALLVESFGRDVVWLYRTGAGARSRRVVRVVGGVLALVILWAALVAPDQLQRLRPEAFARVPLEGLVLVALGLVLPPATRRVVAGVAGLLIGLVVVIKALDVAFYQELGRPFDPVLDWGNLGPGIGVVRVSLGSATTNAALAGAAVVLLAIMAAIVVAAIHLTTVAARHRRRSAGALGALAVVWALSAALALQAVPGAPVASDTSAGIAVAQVQYAAAAVRDQRAFDADLHAADPYASVPAADLLTRLRGKDVVLVFVESYGQVAVQGSSFSGGIDAVLRQGDRRLAGAGFAARSAFLTSPTFGGISWLAHSTLQSGMWVDNQKRYDQLVASDRWNLSSAFATAGWRTVSDIPSDEHTWAPGTDFYHDDQLYDRDDVGYHGPSFSYASMPDQFTLAAFQRLELARGHRPVMAEIDLVSSHTPWTPLPRMVAWDRLGDGSIFDAMPGQGLSPSVAWRTPATVQRLYGESVQYSLRALISWVARLHDRNLVLIMLGDHQPATIVSGPGADHDVPISIVAHDRGILRRIQGWGWQGGLLPDPSAPVWPMDAFRNRFLDAYDAAPVATGVEPVRADPAR